VGHLQKAERRFYGVVRRADAEHGTAGAKWKVHRCPLSIGVMSLVLPILDTERPAVAEIARGGAHQRVIGAADLNGHARREDRQAGNWLFRNLQLFPPYSRDNGL
jgi:hypothetical protein